MAFAEAHDRQKKEVRFVPKKAGFVAV